MRTSNGQTIFEAGDRVETRVGDHGTVVVPNSQELPEPVVLGGRDGYAMTTLVILDTRLDIRTFLTADLQLSDDESDLERVGTETD